MQENIFTVDKNKGEFILACFIGLDEFYVGMEKFYYVKFSTDPGFTEQFSDLVYKTFQLYLINKMISINCAF